MTKLYKAIMHFNRPGSAKGRPWTVHFRGTCYIVREIRCLVPMTSEWKPKKRSNPRAFFTAKAAALDVRNGVATLS
jgi:hypothetical protein